MRIVRGGRCTRQGVRPPLPPVSRGPGALYLLREGVWEDQELRLRDDLHRACSPSEAHEVAAPGRGGYLASWSLRGTVRRSEQH